MRNTIVLIASLMLVALVLTGCGEDGKSEEGQAAQMPAKTVEQYRQEAEKEITAENVEDELTKLEKEIDADAAAE